MTRTAPVDTTGSTIAVGTEITPYTRVTGLASWNRYAAVNDEFVPIHMDHEAGKAAGYDGAFGMGNLQFSYIHNAIRDWAGDSARIASVSCQFRKPNLGGPVTVKGTVSSINESPGGTEVSLEIWTEDEVGDKLAPGTATLLFPAPSSARI